jgi:hypothetical protein
MWAINSELWESLAIRATLADGRHAVGQGTRGLGIERLPE